MKVTSNIISIIGIVRIMMIIITIMSIIIINILFSQFLPVTQIRASMAPVQTTHRVDTSAPVTPDTLGPIVTYSVMI